MTGCKNLAKRLSLERLHTDEPAPSQIHCLLLESTVQRIHERSVIQFAGRVSSPVFSMHIRQFHGEGGRLVPRRLRHDIFDALLWVVGSANKDDDRHLVVHMRYEEEKRMSDIIYHEYQFDPSTDKDPPLSC